MYILIRPHSPCSILEAILKLCNELSMITTYKVKSKLVLICFRFGCRGIEVGYQ